MLRSPRNASAQQALTTRDLTTAVLSPRPSQRQMLELAFEGQPVSDDRRLSREFDAEVMRSPRANGYAPSYPHSQTSARLSGGSWHELSPQGAIMPTTPSYDAMMNSATALIGDDEDTAYIEGANPELFQLGIHEHAKRLGIDPDTERELLWIARESLVAPLPRGWIHATATETGEPYYYNFETGESRWDHPCDDHFRQMVHDMKQRHSFEGSQRYSSSGEMHTASFYEEQAGGGALAVAWQEDYHGSAGQLNSFNGSDQHQHHPREDPWSAGGYSASDTYDQTDSLLTATITTDSTAGYNDPSDLDVADSHSTVISSGRGQSVRGPRADSPSLVEMQTLQIRLEEAETKNRQYEEQRVQERAMIDKLEKMTKDLIGQVEERDQQITKSVPLTEKEALEASVKELRDALDDYETEAKSLRDGHSALQREIEAIRRDKQEDEEGGPRQGHHDEELAELKQEAEREHGRREKLEEELSSLRQELAVVSKDLSESRATTNRLESDLLRKATRENEESKLAAESAASSASVVADLQSRIASLTAEISERDTVLGKREAEFSAAREEIEGLKRHHVKALEEIKSGFEEQLANQETLTNEMKGELGSAKAALQIAMADKVELNAKLEQQSKFASMQQAEAEDAQRTLKRDIRALERDLKALQTVSKEREDEFVATKRVLHSLEQKLREQDEIVASAKRAGYEEAEKAAAETIRQIQAEKARTAELYAQELQTRRKLHNRLMELQGNIRVFCRVRPIQAVEMKSDQSAPAVFYRENDAESLDLVVGGELGPDGKLLNGAGQKHQFEFDHVFQPSSTQEQVFEQTKALVTSALDGFNVCIFAYGQTGSGKTHTMEGPDADRGVNFRSLEELFKIREEREAAGNFECSMKLSILEVYNETVVDLLDNATPPASGLDQRKGLEIRLGKQGVYVENLIEVAVANEKDVTDLMTLGKSHRSVGSHDFNEHSSRSHLVLSINIETVNKTDNKRRVSKLHLIDLAGSERVSKTAASGQRLKEAQNINRSLSALGDVIAALGSNSKHVPYRNSKLTFLLQESLSGNSKVLMFVNVSPVQWNAWETLCSLNFASRCRNVALGLAKASSGSDTPTSSSSSVSKGGGSGIPTPSIKTNGSSGPRASAQSPSVKSGSRVVYG